MWSILNKEESQIAILQPNVTQKYLCTIDSDIQIGTLKVATVTECRWVVTVKEVKTQGYRLEILTLDNHIIKTNNPSVHDVAALNNLFKEIYNELDVEVDRSGKLLKIHNVSQIRNKWQRVRSQLKEMTADETSINSVVQLNDNIFDNDANIFHTVGAIEFFEIYFNGIYGKTFPYNGHFMRKSKFQAADIDWNINYSLSSDRPNNVRFEGTNTGRPSAEWLKNAYGHFIFLEPATLVPLITCKGNYTINAQTGLITSAEYYTEEVVHTQLLYNKIKYTLSAY
ncbi:hypothetical protein GCM10027037_26730 [Mucilaginibacter koreensis]